MTIKAAFVVEVALEGTCKGVIVITVERGILHGTRLPGCGSVVVAQVAVRLEVDFV